MAESQCSPVWKTGTIRRANRGQGRQHRLNVVRSGRPEQSPPSPSTSTDAASLNVVRSGRPEQWRPCITSRGSPGRLNVVRSGRPEQLRGSKSPKGVEKLSQCSPVWKTGTIILPYTLSGMRFIVSMRLIHRGVLVFLS